MSVSDWGSEEEQEDLLVTSHPKSITREDKAEYLYNLVKREWELIRTTRYSADRARKAASLALEAQAEIAEFLSDLEAEAQGVKAIIGVVVGEVQDSIQSSSESKVTDSKMEKLINKSAQVVEAKKNLANAEKVHKKWNHIFLIMKEAHILFRGIGNGKNEF